MIALGIGAVVIAALAAGALYEMLGARLARRRHPPPGRVVELAGARFHVEVRGEGWPAVVLEAGIAASSMNWEPVAERVKQFTRVVRYDRGGLGWSGPARTPRRAGLMVEELRALLGEAGISGPFVLVGHSFGGLLARLFAQRFSGEVAGMVLVDPIQRREWYPLRPLQARMLARGVKLSRRGALLARLGVVRLSLALVMAGARRLPRLIAKVSASGAETPDRIAGEVRKLPRRLWPVVAAHWSQPKNFDSMASHLEQLPASLAELDEARTLDAMPLVVLSGGHLNERQREEHAREAALSMRGIHRVVDGAAHWIHLDQPEEVVRAIREVVEQVRIMGECTT